jgi:hypothetical protein
MAKKEYILEYTGIPFDGIKGKLFDTLDEAETWASENKAGIYWSCARKTNPKSNWPKPVLGSEVDLSEYRMIPGVLETFTEQGMECLGLVLNDPSIKGNPNPQYDPSKPIDAYNFTHYGSYEAIHFIKAGDILQVDGADPIPMIKDRAFAADDAYRLSFYPQGFSRDEFVWLFLPENRKATLWTKKA